MERRGGSKYDYNSSNIEFSNILLPEKNFPVQKLNQWICVSDFRYDQNLAS